MNSIETHVLELIGESATSPDVFTDTDTGMAQIRDSINDAIEEIVMLTGAYREVYQIPLVQDRALYRVKLTHGSFAWATDAWLVSNRVRLTQTDLFKLVQWNPRWMNASGDPQEYFQVGKDIIGVYPVPASTTGVLEITMVVVPERYSSGTDRIKLREEFKWAAVDYAVGEYYASRGDTQRAADYHGKYTGKLGININYPRAAEKQYQFRTNKE